MAERRTSSVSYTPGFVRRMKSSDADEISIPAAGPKPALRNASPLSPVPQPVSSTRHASVVPKTPPPTPVTSEASSDALLLCAL